MATEPPRIDPAVVAWLSELFPDKCPNVTDSDREIWLAAGAVRVIKKLRAVSNNQSTSVLGDDEEDD